MDALLRSGAVSQRDLLSIVSEERARAAGPAVGAVTASQATASAF